MDLDEKTRALVLSVWIKMVIQIAVPNSVYFCVRILQPINGVRHLCFNHYLFLVGLGRPVYVLGSGGFLRHTFREDGVETSMASRHYVI